MNETNLTNTELKLILKLLERERGDLPGEIRRCGVSTAHDELRSRLRFVEALIAKVTGFVTT